MPRRLLPLLVGLLVAAQTASAEPLDPQQIANIKETAAAICNTVKEIKGDKTDVQIQGQIRGQLSGLVGRLAAAGGSGTGSLTRDEFEGLTQDATGIALTADRECRERLFNKMFDQLSLTSMRRPPAQAKIDCTPLKPNVPRNISSEATGKIDAKLQRFVAPDASLDGTYKDASKDVLKEYPNADRLYIWDKMIYFHCEALNALDIPAGEKLDRLEKLEEHLDRPPPADKSGSGRDQPAAPKAEEKSAVDLFLEADRLVGQRRYKEALPAVEQAARLGNVDAQVALGILYTSGLEGIPWNPERAFQLFKSAAGQGNGSAIARLGISYFKGQGVPQNIAEAVRYTKMGVERGDPLSIDTMGYFLEHGVGDVAPEPCKALQYYRRSAELGSGSGQLSLASMYLKGLCVPKSVKQARELLAKSAASGNPDAVAGLKLMHEKGLDAD